MKIDGNEHIFELRNQFSGLKLSRQNNNEIVLTTNVVTRSLFLGLLCSCASLLAK